MARLCGSSREIRRAKVYRLLKISRRCEETSILNQKLERDLKKANEQLIKAVQHKFELLQQVEEWQVCTLGQEEYKCEVAQFSPLID